MCAHEFNTKRCARKCLLGPRFTLGETDVLVATTILENGIDIPNVTESATALTVAVQVSWYRKPFVFKVLAAKFWLCQCIVGCFTWALGIFHVLYFSDLKCVLVTETRSRCAPR